MAMTGYRYDRLFFDINQKAARVSSGPVIDAIRSDLQIASVLDVGCGRGMWPAEWRARGIADTVGVDGDYVDRASLAIPSEAFVAADISSPFDLGRRFDLVECLEVGEHIPTARSEELVRNLVRHGDLVLFSAAPPGQGGEYHVNEQPLSFWRRLFRAHDYHPFDAVRPRIAHDYAIQPWYRYNTLLYVRSSAIGALPAKLAQTRIADGEPIPDFAPLLWRLRCGVLRFLPVETTTRLAVLKHRLFAP